MLVLCIIVVHFINLCCVHMHAVNALLISREYRCYGKINGRNSLTYAH